MANPSHHVPDDDSPLAWLRSLSNPHKIYPLRSPPHPTTVGRSDDCDIVLPSQSVSRRHCSVQLSDDPSNPNAIAILRDSSFNGCFLGDDLVRNRAEWMGVGDVVRFGNDKEKYVLETMEAMNQQPQGQENQDSRVVSHVTAGGADVSGSIDDPYRQMGDHGGPAAGAPSEHGDRFRQLSPVRHNDNSYTQAPSTRGRSASPPPNRPAPAWSAADPGPRPTAPPRQDWSLSYPTATGPAHHRQSFDPPPRPAAPAFDPEPTVFTNAEPVFEVSDKARNIYGGTLGGSAPAYSGAPAQPPTEAWANQAQSDPPMPARPPVPSPQPAMSIPAAQAAPFIPNVPSPAAAAPMDEFRDSLDAAPDLPASQDLPPLSSLILPDPSHTLTASERAAIIAEKNETAKHMRDLNMLLAGTLDPVKVPFVFTEPEDAALDDEPTGMGRRTPSTGSLHSRAGMDRAQHRQQLKREHDKQLVARCLNVLEKHKIRGLQRGWNKWKLEVRSMNMSLAEKRRMAAIEAEQKAKDDEIANKLQTQINENKQRSAIQLMIDSKKRGKQLQLLAGWNTWKTYMTEHKKSEFHRALRNKDSANAVNRIAKMISSNKMRKLFSAMNKWRTFVLNELKAGGEADSKYVEVLKNRGDVLAGKVTELEETVKNLTDELESLKVEDWAQALSKQQKITASLRRQLGRAERGWAAESAAFAAAALGKGEYEPQRTMVPEPGVGSGLAGVLHQRKLKKNMLAKGGPTAGMKEKRLEPGTRSHPKVRQVQAYIVGKAREIATIRREMEEWKRRAQASGRNWSALATERDELARALEESKDSAVRQSSELLDMVRERDGRIMKLQNSLVGLASLKENKAPGGGVLKNASTTEKKVKILSKKQQAAAFLAEEFAAMQKESTDRAQSLVQQLIEMRESRKAQNPLLTLPPESGELQHKVLGLQGKVRRLEDELRECEVQGGVRALVEAQELIDALQDEVALGARKLRVLTTAGNTVGGGSAAEIANRILTGSSNAGNGAPDTARSGMSTPSMPPSKAMLQQDVDEAWNIQLGDAAKRLEDAEDTYKKELGASGAVRDSAIWDSGFGDGDDDDDYDYNNG